jgi:hypothetical protein
MIPRPAIALMTLVALGSMGQSCDNIQITSPAPGSVFTSAQTVTLRLGHVGEVAPATQVDFLLDGSVACVDYSPPFTCDWPITGAENGAHSWSARALIGSRVVAWSPPTPVTVSIEAVAAGDPELVGFVPAVGSAVGVAVDGARDLAFVASREFGLSVVDVRDPLDPVTLGATNPPFQGFRVALSGSLAVVTNDSALKVVDVSDPSNPVPVGNLETSQLNDVAVAGRYAYVLLRVPGNPAHVDLAVVDLGQPSNPVLRGQVTVPGWGEAVEVVGGRAYVAAGSSSLQVFDVSNPFSPYPLGGVDTPGSAIAVTVHGSHAYVGEYSAVHAIDISSPSNPVRRGQVGVRGTDLAVSGGKLYAGSGLGVSVIGLSNPAFPSLAGTDPSLPTLGLDAAGDQIYMAFGGVPNTSENWGGLFVIDASTPSSLELLGTAFGLTEIGRIAVDDGTAVVSGGNLLKVVDLSEPQAPEVLGQLSTYAINDVALSGRYGYVLIRIPGNPAHVDLAVVDLGQPGNPVLRGQVAVPGWGNRVEIVGSRAYVAAGSSGLQVFDVGNPASPYRIGGVDTPGNASALTVSGNYAYLGEMDAVHVIDIRNPANPIRRGQVGARASDLALVGSQLCASSGLGLSTIDVSNPNAPFVVSTDTTLTGQSSSVVGDRLLLAEWFNDGGPQPRGFARVVDISDPSGPQLLTEVLLPGASSSSATDGTRVYFQDTVGTVSVIEFQP